MANLTPVTLQNIQDSINALASFSVDTPDPSDDQWLTRLNYINLAITNWANADVSWLDLFVPYTGGTITTATQYPINVKDFRRMSSLLRLYDAQGNRTYVDIIKPENVTQFTQQARKAYITGNQAIGYTLNLCWTPQTTDAEYGQSFSFDYYSSGNKLVAPTDKPQMSDPNYIIYSAASMELMFNGSYNQAQSLQAMADTSMDNMRIKNELVPAYADNTLEDVDVLRSNFVFGE